MENRCIHNERRTMVAKFVSPLNSEPVVFSHSISSFTKLSLKERHISQSKVTINTRLIIKNSRRTFKVPKFNVKHYYHVRLWRIGFRIRKPNVRFDTRFPPYTPSYHKNEDITFEKKFRIFHY